ncbi:MAG: zinc dependent phospholipase C family protein [Phycisphaerae bacterium]
MARLRTGWLVALIVLAAAPAAWAWGPLTHIHLADELLASLWAVPVGVASILARYRRYFVFGNVAADVVLAKKLSRVKQVCHSWSTAWSLLERAETDPGRAFAYGYLSHLAADTVAHNKFLPWQIVAAGSTVTLGHLYWEIRADAAVPPGHWTGLRSVLAERYPEPERLLAAHLTRTLLPYRVNRHLFQRMNLLQCADGWRRSVRVASLLSRWPIDLQVLAEFHAESLERIRSVLSEGRSSAVLHEDPNGNSALLFTRHQRRLLRRMKRARLPTQHVVRETVRGHAPLPGRALSAAAHSAAQITG